MGRLLDRLLPKMKRPWAHPAILALVAGLSYGPLIPWLGFYWDDWPKAWFLHTLGPSGFHEVYALDRPYLAWTYQLTTAILGESPIAWQAFGVFSRWLSAVALWWLLRQIWPKRKDVAVVASLILLIFPGFSGQHVSLIFSHYLFIQAVHLFSLGSMLKALRMPGRAVGWTIVSIAGALYSLFSLEYYVGLELVRPLLIWWVAGEVIQPTRKRMMQTFRRWILYAPILPIFVIWRTQVIGYPTYQPSFLVRILDQPLGESLEELGRLFAKDLFEVVVGSWLRLVPLPEPQSFGLISWSLFAAVVVVVWILAGVYLYRFNRDQGASGRLLFGPQSRLPALVTGITALLAAGWPFWLTDLPLRLSFPNDRIVLAFMVGGSLVLASLIPISHHSVRTRYAGIALAAILVGLAAGQQIRYATEFRRDWEAQNDLLWQFIWRVPDLKDGTTILTNELPLEFDDDESVTAAINWIYGRAEDQGRMRYLVADLKLRLGRSFARLEEDLPIYKPYRATHFAGNTSDVIVMAYEPPKCLRMFDVILHDSLPGIPEPLTHAIPLSKLDAILPDTARALELPLNVLAPEPPHRWCYYFQKAALARQRGDWDEIASLGDVAFALDDRPNDASERLPFIEGYAHVGRWQEAIKLSHQVVDEQPAMRLTVCRTWFRLETTAHGEVEGKVALESIYQSLPCD